MHRHLLPALAVTAGLLTLALAPAPVTAAAPTDPDLLKISRGVGGADLDGVAYEPDVSADGRWVVYETGADNVVAGDVNNGFDVVLFDTRTRTSRMPSLGGDGDSFDAHVSDGGGRVLFRSRADDLVAGDGDGQPNAFVWDRANGRVRRVDVARGGGDPNGQVTYAALSGDGRWVAFVSEATNLVRRPVRAGVRHLYLRDLRTGRTRVLDPRADGDAYDVSVDARGRHVAVVSAASNLVPDPTGVDRNVLVWTVGKGTPRNLTPGPGFPEAPDLSADGRRVAFLTSGELVPADDDGSDDVYLRDLGRPSPRLVSGAVDDLVQHPSISADGRYVGLDTDAPLVGFDANGTYDCYRWDSRTGRFSRMSKDADAASSDGVLSRAGRFAAYVTDDLSFFPDDDNGFTDIARRRFSG